MTVLIYKFNNGVFLKQDDSDSKTPLMYKKEALVALEPVGSHSYYEKSFFIPSTKQEFESSELTLRNSLVLPMGYVLINEGKLKKSITVEDYENLTDYYKSLYKKSSQKEHVSYEPVESAEVLVFDKNYEPLNLSELTDFQKKVKALTKTPLLMSSLLPSAIQYLFEKEISGESIFNILVEEFKDVPRENSKGQVHNYISSIDVKIYEHEYTGEMARREILKQNGGHYATRKYRQVRDLPKVAEVRSYSAVTLNYLNASTEKELILKVEKLIKQIVESVL